MSVLDPSKRNPRPLDLEDLRKREAPPRLQTSAGPFYPHDAHSLGRSNKWDGRFMRMAAEVAGWSKDPQVKVGAVVVSPDRRRFSTGYNGFPVGVRDTDARLDGEHRNALTVHAELNAILNAGVDLAGWTLYATRQPCLECAKAIVQARIARVVSPLLPRDSSWVKSCDWGGQLMREAGVTTDYLVDEETPGIIKLEELP